MELFHGQNPLDVEHLSPIRGKALEHVTSTNSDSVGTTSNGWQNNNMEQWWDFMVTGIQ